MQQVWYKGFLPEGKEWGRTVRWTAGVLLQWDGSNVLELWRWRCSYDFWSHFFFLLSFTVVCVLVQSGCQTAPADGIFFSRHLGKHSRLVFRDQERESVAWMLKNLNFFTISKETLLMCHEQLSSLFSQHLGRYYNLTTDGSLTSLLRSLLSLIRTVDMVPCKCHSAIMKYG